MNESCYVRISRKSFSLSSIGGSVGVVSVSRCVTKRIIKPNVKGRSLFSSYFSAVRLFVHFKLTAIFVRLLLLNTDRSLIISIPHVICAKYTALFLSVDDD